MDDYYYTYCWISVLSVVALSMMPSSDFHRSQGRHTTYFIGCSILVVVGSTRASTYSLIYIVKEKGIFVRTGKKSLSQAKGSLWRETICINLKKITIVKTSYLTFFLDYLKIIINNQRFNLNLTLNTSKLANSP